MIILAKLLFFISIFIIFWAMIGYPLSLILINKKYENRKLIKDYTLKPTVTIMVVAHNEEKVILDKLNNITKLDYPKDKIKYIISSDNSVDKTNHIVKDYIIGNPQYDITLYEVQERKGKTNAQNEAQKLVDTDFLVMTDANAILEATAIKELMAAFTSSDISYVTGKLTYINDKVSNVSESENSYWNLDLAVREIESRIQTITAGNGALYACRNSEYYNFNPIESHDSSMPLYYALKGKKAIANHDALAYEKAGERIEDEFSRKVRMNRMLLKHILPSIKVLNFFKYKWFTYFYLGHRTSRYLLWISHLALYLSNLLLLQNSVFYVGTFVLQTIFFGFAIIKPYIKTNNKIINMIYYYGITIYAQWLGVINTIIGKSKPFWEKAESTR